MLVKDKNTGFIINTDDKELKLILNQREQAKKQKAVCKEIDNIKNDLGEIKEILKTLIFNKENNIQSIKEVN